MIGKNLVGQRFGRLVVIEEEGRNKRREKLWLCKCDCGNTKITSTTSLTSGGTSSCGCYRRECELSNLSKFLGKTKTHGFSKTRLYRVWADLKKPLS